MNELVPAFETSLFETSISEIGIEFAELGIDSILQDGLLKDIPIVGTIVNVGKFAQNANSSKRGHMLRANGALSPF